MAVNRKARTVTVQGQDGQAVTLQVPAEAQNLDQVHPGSQFLVRYLESVAVAISPVGGAPSADTAATVQLAPKGAAPGGVIAQVLEIQARVDSIDYKKRTMVLKGPEGNRVKLAVDPGVKRLNEVKVGDMVVVAYTEALAAEMIQR
jgi:hypothetical protein